MIRAGHRGVGLDNPDESRKKHTEPISRLGGVPLMIAVVLGGGAIWIIEPGKIIQWVPVLVGCALMFGLGLWDDLYSVGARKKLLGADRHRVARPCAGVEYRSRLLSRWSLERRTRAG